MHDLTGESFQAAEVADLYVHRPPYAEGAYSCLIEQAPQTGRLLDLGCGEGKIARPLATTFDQVVAVDPSATMIALGKTLENGQAHNIDWIEAKAEDAPLEGKFDLVTFGASIHWMDPKRLFARLRAHVNKAHLVAFVAGDGAFEPPWEADWQSFLTEWVPKVTGRPMGSKEWTTSRIRHLDHVVVSETREFISDPFAQSVESFILCQHSRNTFALSAMADQVDAFRRDLRALLDPYADKNGLLSYRVQTRVTLATFDSTTA